MRKFTAIIRYELLMQMKSLRFKGLVVLLIILNYHIYQMGIRLFSNIEIQTILRDNLFPLIFGAIVFAGLFPVGRIQKNNIHSILMVRPFSTISLVTGQMIAALISLLILSVMLFFPAGLLLNWRYHVGFRPFDFIFLLIFAFMPAYLDRKSVV